MSIRKYSNDEYTIQVINEFGLLEDDTDFTLKHMSHLFSVPFQSHSNSHEIGWIYIIYLPAHYLININEKKYLLYILHCFTQYFIFLNYFL